MTKSEILKEIEIEQEILSILLNQDDEILSFLETFIKDSEIDKLTDYSKIDLINLIISYSIVKNEGKNFRIQKEAFSGISKMINTSDIEEFIDFIISTSSVMYADYMSANYRISDTLVPKILDEDLEIEKKKILLELAIVFMETDKYSQEELELFSEKMVKYMEQDPESFMQYMSCLYNFPAELGSPIELAVMVINRRRKEIKLRKKFKADLATEMQWRKMQLSAIEQEEIIKRAVKDAINDDESQKELKDKLKEIVNYQLDHKKTNISNKRKINKKISQLKEIKETIKNSDGKELRVSQAISKIENDGLELEILKYIYLHNLEIYRETEEEYRRLKIGERLKYQKILELYGMEIDEETSVLYEYSVEELKKTLPIIQKIGITRLSDLEDITKETLDFYLEMIDGKEMTVDFIKNHQEILSEDLCERIRQNRKALAEKRINTTTFEEKQIIYLIDPERLQSNLDLLEENELLDIKNSNDISYLSIERETLQNRIDRILELGYERVLEETKDLLNYSEEDWDKIQVLKDLGIEINTKEELLKQLNERNSLISNRKIKDYMESTRDVISEERIENLTETQLNQFSDSKRCYKIGELYFSKKKVERNYESEGDFYQALVANRKLNIDEQATVRQEIKNKVLSI